MTQIRPRLTHPGVALGVLAAALLFGPGPSAAGAANYQYTVTGVDYNAGAGQGAARAYPGCVSGESATWSGNVSAGQGLSPISLGDGSVEIRKSGTHGRVDAKDNFDFNFSARHRIYNNCAPPPDFAFTDTTCTEPISSAVEVIGVIVGGKSNKVKVIWHFDVTDVAGAWVPDTFRCAEEGFRFEQADCRSKVRRKTFKPKTVTLAFNCATPIYETPPSGSGYSEYYSGVYANGSVTLKRP